MKYYLIQYQILQTGITTIVLQTVRRITNKIVGVEGLKLLTLEINNPYFYNISCCNRF